MTEAAVRSVTLFTRQGVEQVLAEAKASRERAGQLLEMLEGDPRAAIGSVFRLTRAQRMGLARRSDAELRARVEPLLECLEAGRLDLLTVSTQMPVAGAGARPGGPVEVHIGC